MTHLNCAGRLVDLSAPAIMGIVNVTPDSFSDGGVYFDTHRAIEHGLRLAEQGAGILDIGGESTRPGAQTPEPAEELRRVVPVIEALSQQATVAISVDTSSPEVMRQAVSAGAGLINDVRALERPGALETAASCGVPVCLMHMRGRPETMQDDPVYENVVAEVKDYLSGRAGAAVAAGIARDKIIVDPGFGFGKTLAHNLQLLNGLEHLCSLGFPLLAGLSRKSSIAKIMGTPSASRLGGSIALAIKASEAGAAILRVHDVEATREALTVWRAASAEIH